MARFYWSEEVVFAFSGIDENIIWGYNCKVGMQETLKILEHTWMATCHLPEYCRTLHFDADIIFDGIHTCSSQFAQAVSGDL